MRPLLERIGRAIARNPVPVLAIAVVITAAGLYGTFRIGVETDISTMLPKDNPAGMSFNEISDAFQTTSTLIVMIEGSDRATIIDGAEEFAKRVQVDERTAPLIRSVRLTVNRDFVDRWGFMMEEAEDISDSGRILQSTRLLPLITATNDYMEEKLSDGSDEEVEGPEGEDDSTATMARFALFARDLRSAIEVEDTTSGTENADIVAKKLADDYLIGDRYYFDPEGKTLLMTVTPNFDLSDRKALTDLMKGTEALGAEIVQELGPEKAKEKLRFSFAGDVAAEADEDKAISADLFYPMIIAIALIFVLFVFSFNSLRSVLFALVALLVGLLADLGFVAVSVGKLNMVTSSFGALLVGLGIDFGIHISSRYDEAMAAGESSQDAMAEVFGVVILPVAIGAITTAAAFYSLGLSDTPAFRQFGIVAGTGILTTLISACVVLPALLATFPKKYRGQKDVAGKNGTLTKKRPVLTYKIVAKAGAAAARHSRIVLAATLVVTIGLAFLIPRNSFEYDMRKIGPQGTAASKTEDIIGERFGISTYQTLATAGNLEEIRGLAEQMRDAPLIRRVESLADYVPSPEEQTERLAAIREIAAQENRDTPFSWDADAVGAFVEEIRRLEMNLIELGDLAAASLGEDSLPVRARTATIREIFGAEIGRRGEEVYSRLAEKLEEGDPSTTAAKLATIDDAFAAALDRQVTTMTSADRPVTETDIPDDILVDFRSPDGKLYLAIAQPSRDLRGNAAMEQLTEGLAKITQNATGSLILGVELSREMLTESRSASIIIAFIVVVLVAIGFRSLGATIAVCLSFLVGMIWTFGIYPLFGTFNIVNILALPLIIGVGIDYSVHVVSALRETKGNTLNHANIAQALTRTGKAVTLSALTTMIGFGSLALAGSFEGIATLGATLFIGVGCSLFSAGIILPALTSILPILGNGKTDLSKQNSSKIDLKEVI